MCDWIAAEEAFQDNQAMWNPPPSCTNAAEIPRSRGPWAVTLGGGEGLLLPSFAYFLSPGTALITALVTARQCRTEQNASEHTRTDEEPLVIPEDAREHPNLLLVCVSVGHLRIVTGQQRAASIITRPMFACPNRPARRDARDGHAINGWLPKASFVCPLRSALPC